MYWSIERAFILTVRHDLFDNYIHQAIRYSSGCFQWEALHAVEISAEKVIGFSFQEASKRAEKSL